MTVRCHRESLRVGSCSILCGTVGRGSNSKSAYRLVHTPGDTGSRLTEAVWVRQ